MNGFICCNTKIHAFLTIQLFRSTWFGFHFWRNFCWNALCSLFYHLPPPDRARPFCLFVLYWFRFWQIKSDVQKLTKQLIKYCECKVTDIYDLHVAVQDVSRQLCTNSNTTICPVSPMVSRPHNSCKDIHALFTPGERTARRQSGFPRAHVIDGAAQVSRYAKLHVRPFYFFFLLLTTCIFFIIFTQLFLRFPISGDARKACV